MWDDPQGGAIADPGTYAEVTSRHGIMMPAYVSHGAAGPDDDNAAAAAAETVVVVVVAAAAVAAEGVESLEWRQRESLERRASGGPMCVRSSGRVGTSASGIIQ